MILGWEVLKLVDAKLYHALGMITLTISIV